MFINKAQWYKALINNAAKIGHCQWRFRTSKFNPKVSGLKLFEVHEHTKTKFLEKKYN